MGDVLAPRFGKPRLPYEAERALFEFFRFASDMWGLDLEEKPHREMCDVLQANEFSDATPFTMLVVPRGTYKTSLARALAVWKQLRQVFLYQNPFHRVVLASATLRLGEQSLALIEQQLRYRKPLNEAYGPLWQNRTRDLMSSKTEWGISHAFRVLAGANPRVSEPSFWIASSKACVTGLHADEAIVDDLNNKENTATTHQRVKVQTDWELLFPLIGTEDGTTPKITFLATPWHDDDVRGRILRDERQRDALTPDYRSPWTVMHRGSAEADGSPFFPSKYPIERLEELRQSMGPREYASNYLCDCVGESGFVNEDQIVFKSPDAFPSLRDCRITVDPHQHKEARELGCYAAIVIAGYDKYARMWVQDVRGSREWSTQQLIDALFDIYEKYPYPIFMEDSHMAHFAQAVSMEEARRSGEEKRRVHLRISYVPVDVRTTKYERWMRLHPRFVNRGIFFSHDILPELKQEMREELIRGESARFKDFLDALAMAESGVRPKLNKDGTFREVDAKAPPAVPQGEIPGAPFTYADLYPDFATSMTPCDNPSPRS